VITNACQRWRTGRDSYRPAGEPIATALYDVAPIPGTAVARDFVEAHHYSRSYPAARERIGLYRGGALVGVAIFSVPAQPRALTVLGVPTDDAVELGRLVLLDDVPANGETWFLGQCFAQLRREGYAGVVSFSDPAPRTRADGSILHGGHVGVIYQAHNAVYLGRSKAETRRILPDGTLLHGRAVAKIRKLDKGWRYAAALLEAHGAEPLAGGDPAAWLARWIPALTRPLAHPGNFKYAWRLDRRGRRSLPASLPYPKINAAAVRPFGGADGSQAAA